MDAISEVSGLAAEVLSPPMTSLASTPRCLRLYQEVVHRAGALRGRVAH